MPQVSAALVRSAPSKTIASANIRRDAALSFSRPAAARSSMAVKSLRVTAIAAIVLAPHHTKSSSIQTFSDSGTATSHPFSPLVLSHKNTYPRSLQRPYIQPALFVEGAISSDACDDGTRCGAPTTRIVSGAPGGAAPGRRASQPCRVRRTRPGAGLASLSRIGARAARSQGRPKGRRSAAPWRLPALHSPLGKRKKGNRRVPRPPPAASGRAIGDARLCQIQVIVDAPPGFVGDLAVA